MRKFSLTTVLLGILIGGSTLSMIAANQTFIYITGTIALVLFLIAFIREYIKN